MHEGSPSVGVSQGMGNNYLTLEVMYYSAWITHSGFTGKFLKEIIFTSLSKTGSENVCIYLDMYVYIYVEEELEN
jgi:hypothetical protein